MKYSNLHIRFGVGEF